MLFRSKKKAYDVPVRIIILPIYFQYSMKTIILFVAIYNYNDFFNIQINFNKQVADYIMTQYVI